jgi:hypothetical protein
MHYAADSEAAMGKLSLLMVHHDDHAEVLRGGVDDAETRSATAAERPASPQAPSHLWDEGGDPNDLPAQRWGVIAPADERGDVLLRQIRPLIEHRRRQQGAEPIIYRVEPSHVDTVEKAARWRKTVFETGAKMTEDLPRYQLILGDLHEVPIALQQSQGGDGYVGRLAFDDLAAYSRYAEKVIAWEGGTPGEPGAALFHTVHDGTKATEAGYGALVAPGLQLARAAKGAGSSPRGRSTRSGTCTPPIPTTSSAQQARRNPRSCSPSATARARRETAGPLLRISVPAREPWHSG